MEKENIDKTILLSLRDNQKWCAFKLYFLSLYSSSPSETWIRSNCQSATPLPQQNGQQGPALTSYVRQTCSFLVISGQETRIYIKLNVFTEATKLGLEAKDLPCHMHLERRCDLRRVPSRERKKVQRAKKSLDILVPIAAANMGERREEQALLRTRERQDSLESFKSRF